MGGGMVGLERKEEGLGGEEEGKIDENVNNNKKSFLRKVTLGQ